LPPITKRVRQIAGFKRGKGKKPLQKNVSQHRIGRRRDEGVEGFLMQKRLPRFSKETVFLKICAKSEEEGGRGRGQFR